MAARGPRAWQRACDGPPCPPTLELQFVTMHQLIDWMRNPIPKDQMKEKFNVRGLLTDLTGWNSCGAVKEGWGGDAAEALFTAE